MHALSSKVTIKFKTYLFLQFSHHRLLVFGLHGLLLDCLQIFQAHELYFLAFCLLIFGLISCDKLSRVLFSFWAHVKTSFIAWRRINDRSSKRSSTFNKSNWSAFWVVCSSWLTRNMHLVHVHFLLRFFLSHLHTESISRGAPDPDTDPAGYPVNLVDPGRIRPDPIYLDPARIRPDLR